MHMKITILGCGRWGTFLAWYFNKKGYSVLLWGRSASENIKILKKTRKNNYVYLPFNIKLSSSLSEALAFSNYIIIAINEQNLRSFMVEIIRENYFNKTFVLCMKGLEKNTSKRLSEVVYEFVEENAKIAIWVGPGQPFDLLKGNSTSMLIDSKDTLLTNTLINKFGSKLIHIYAGNDLIGNEIGAAASKVIGIAGGVLDGLGYASLKGILMVIGTKEISNIISTMGGNPNSAYGLCCLGDYYASVFSENSNSVNYGKSIAKNMEFNKHVPGVFTANALVELSHKFDISIPLLTQILSVIYKIDSPQKIIKNILNYDERGVLYGGV